MSKISLAQKVIFYLPQAQKYTSIWINHALNLTLTWSENDSV